MFRFVSKKPTASVVMVERHRCITALFYILGGGNRFLWHLTGPCPPVDLCWNLTTACLLGSTVSPVWIQCRVMHGNCYINVRVIWYGSSDVETLILVTNRLVYKNYNDVLFLRKAVLIISLWVWHFTVQSLIIWVGWCLTINYLKLKGN
jgi:hypothetical protein